MPKKKIYDYEADDITVRYEPRRCIHAAECIAGLPGVFERDRRPWIDPERASADAISEVVVRCPTGALRFERTDGGPQEPVPEANVARLVPDGPLFLEGQLELRLPDGTTCRDCRMALCRCGASRNKPFCDNSHIEAGFRAAEGLGAAMLAAGDPQDLGTAVEISLAPNGPALIRGPIAIESSDGTDTHSGVKGALCRCGASANKPYCDGSHVAAQFRAE